jgi:hypothetical protein
MISNPNDWISVKKYNPPFNIAVLAIIKHPEEIDAREIQVCFMSEEGAWVCEPTYEDNREELSIFTLEAEITHWMPLPEMPNNTVKTDDKFDLNNYEAM